MGGLKGAGVAVLENFQMHGSGLDRLDQVWF